MVLLIRAGNSDGEYVSCDSECYDAKLAACNCVCGGRNHGKGRAQAEDNTQKYAERIVAEWKEKHPDHEVAIQLQLI